MAAVLGSETAGRDEAVVITGGEVPAEGALEVVNTVAGSKVETRPLAISRL